MERLQQVRQLLKHDDVVYVVTAHSLSEPHDPILLVLAVNLPVKDTKMGIPKIHRVKGRGDLVPLNYKSVSQLELVECGADASLSMTYAKKRYDWVIREGSTARNTFVWWVLQTCRVYNDEKLPACNLDPLILHQLTSQFVSTSSSSTSTSTSSSSATATASCAPLTASSSSLSLLENINNNNSTSNSTSTSTSSGSVNKVTMYVLEQVRKYKQQAEDTQGFDIPPMKESEASDIEYFLAKNELNVGNMDELEELLREKLRELEDLNIRDLFFPEYLQSAQLISNKLDGVSAEISLLQTWMSTSDEELVGMRTGLEKMTVQLEVQENNLERLVQVLEPVLRSLTLKEEDIRILETSNFASTSLEVVLLSLKELDNALRTRLPGNLQHMEAVSTQRKKLKSIRSRVCMNATNYLCSMFEQNKQQQHDITHLSHHDRLIKYKELVRYIERLEAEKYVELQQNYMSQFSRVYEMNITNYLNASRNGVNHETQKHTKFSALPENSVTSQSRRNAPPPPPPSGSSNGGKKEMTEIFPSTLHALLTAVNNEQQFLDDFFGMQSDTTNNDEDEDEERSPTNASRSRIHHNNAQGGVVIHVENGSGEQREEDEEEEDDDEEGEHSLRPAKAKGMLQNLFKSLEGELKSLIDWADKLDHFYSLDMLVVIERESEGKINDFSMHLISHLRTHLNHLFRVFVEGEIHWIASQKVAAKRCGVLAPFVKFPLFVDRMESTSQRGRSQAVDATYQRIVGALFSHLDSVAASDEKYTEVVQLENHYYFWRVFSNRADSIPALDPFVAASKTKFQAAMKRYITWNVEYEMDTIAKFWTKLEAALKSVSKLTEIPIMADLSKQELHKLIQEHMTNHKITKRIRLMLERIQKHLTVSELVLEVWSELKTYFIARYKWFEGLVSQCYTKEQLIVPSKDIPDIFDAVWAMNETDKKKPRHKRSVSISRSTTASRSTIAGK